MNEQAGYDNGIIHQKSWVITMFMTLGIIITLVSFWLTRSDELEKFHNEFEKDAAIHSYFIQHKLESSLLVTESLIQLFYASDAVEPHEFKTFTSPLLAQIKEISAIAWVRRVPRGAAASSPSQSKYAYPFIYIEPSNSIFRHAPGFDMGSSPVFLQAVERAQVTGKAVVLMDARLLNNIRCAVVLAPIYFTDSEVPPGTLREENLRGIIVTILEHDNLRKRFQEIAGSEAFNLALLDLSARNGKVIAPRAEKDIVSSPGPVGLDEMARASTKPRSGKGVDRAGAVQVFESSVDTRRISVASGFLPAAPVSFLDFTFADRALAIQLTAGHDYMKQAYPFAFWSVLPVGFILTLLLCLYLRSVLSRRQKLEYLVEERTAELRKSEQSYRMLADNALDVIWILDLDLHHVYVSPSVKSLRAYEVEEAMQQSFEEVLTPDSFRKARELLDEETALRECGKTDSERSKTVELEMYRKDGSTVWTEAVISLLCTPEGIPRGIMGITRDISERKITELALRESEEKYRLLVENASEAIFVGQDGMFKFANTKTSELLHASPEELMLNGIGSYIHPEDRDMVMDRHFRRLRGEDVPKTYPLRVITGKKQTLWVELNTVRIIWEGKPATLTFLTDISERVNAEEGKKSLEKQLAQAQKMESIGTLAGGIAHDFNNILSSVLGYAGLARMKGEKGEPVQDEIDQVMKAGIRARDLVKQILTFSRQTEIKKEAVMLSPLIKESVKLLRASIPSTVEIRQDLAAGSATVMADPTQIHQIVMNLCTNAAHAMKEHGGTLSLALKEISINEAAREQHHGIEMGAFVELVVSDTGVGIPMEIINRIFDPFFTTKERGEGTGMGLSVVHGIVKEMGGTIQVFSSPEKGTAFHVLMPVYAGGSALQHDEPLAPKKGWGRILFIDDEEGILESGKGILSQLGYTVFTSQDPAGALEILRADPRAFDLIITDMTMPKMTGIELSEQIHAIRPDIPVVLCTGFEYDVMKDKMRGAGITSMVMKPLVPGELAEVVSYAMGSGPLKG